MLVLLTINNAKEKIHVVRVCRSLFCQFFGISFFIFHRMNIWCERMKNLSDHGFVLESHTHTQQQHRMFLLMRQTTVAERYINKLIRSDNAISWSFHSCCRKCDSQSESRFTCKMNRATYLNATNIKNIFSTFSLRTKETDLWPLNVVLVDRASFCSIYRMFMFRNLGTHICLFNVYAFVYYKVRTKNANMNSDICEKCCSANLHSIPYKHKYAIHGVWCDNFS